MATLDGVVLYPLGLAAWCSDLVGPSKSEGTIVQALGPPAQRGCRTCECGICEGTSNRPTGIYCLKIISFPLRSSNKRSANVQSCANP